MTLQRREMDWLHRKLLARRQGRAPLSGTLELTRRCNFSCRHCYLRGTPGPGRELDTGQVLHLLDQLADAGCLYLGLSGGEPFLRRDMSRIVWHAVSAGMLVTVQTNGSLIDDGLADALARRPPRRIDISLYGYSEDTYRQVTGVAGMRNRVFQAIDRLRQRGLQVRLNVPLLVPLAGELSRLNDFAAARDIPLRIESTIDPTLGGDRKPCRLRLPADRAAALEASLSTYHAGDDRGDSDRRSGCQAGRQGFYIDAAGGLRPCVHLIEPRRDVLAEGFSAAWRRLEGFSPPRLDSAACGDCAHAQLCSACPLMARGEDAPGPGSFYCRLARERSRLRRHHQQEVGAA
ncbi:MAG: hypothetical protein DRI34_09215 [Deltaproteobacteria bacterium]|nr:MAG: hypothetical protein DRI34_09215 [Deltaproteobacteria bacterium]